MSDQKVEILPCPFCGTQAVMKSKPYDNQTGHISRVICGNPFCDADHDFASAKDAAEAWNRRATDENAALERAAMVCEELIDEGKNCFATDCAAAIRALKK